MVDFELGAELELVRETARNFARTELQPRERDHEKARSVERVVAEKFAATGLSGVELPESCGGAGLGAVARALVLEELAAVDAGAATALDPLGPASYVLAECGGEAALRELALPLLEPPGKRALLVLERALDPGVRALDLEVPWVPADRVDLLVVLGPQGACALREGIALEPLRGAGLRAAGAAALRVEGARPIAHWADPAGAQRALARARVYVAALLVGVMRASAEYSRNYAQQRVAFGRPIAHHQALAFLIADMAAAVDATRWLVWEAAARLERGDAAEAAVTAEAAATAFVEACEQSLFVTPNGLQILGGHGFMQDYPVEKWMREARALGLLLGGVDGAREDAGRALMASSGDTALPMWEA